jgi:hypothetical protein
MRHFSRVFIACRAPSNSYRVHPSPVPVLGKSFPHVAASLPFKSFARFIIKVDRALSDETLLNRYGSPGLPISMGIEMRHATFRVNYVLHQFLKSAILFLRLRMLALVSVPTFHLKTAPGSRAQLVVGWKSHSRRISRLKQPRFYWRDSVDHTDGAMETPIEMLLDTRLPAPGDKFRAIAKACCLY